jgi:hypothetical protein
MPAAQPAAELSAAQNRERLQGRLRELGVTMRGGFGMRRTGNVRLPQQSQHRNNRGNGIVPVDNHIVFGAPGGVSV